MNPYSLLLNESSLIGEDKFRKERNEKNYELLKTNPQINVDLVLAGKDKDTRYSCSIVTRPNQLVKALIEGIQAGLRNSISNPECLWVSPSTHLHLTLLEICFNRSKEYLASIVEEIGKVKENILSSGSDGPSFDHPLICFDANAIALTFISKGESHIKYREKLYDSVSSFGISIQPRYATPSAHITIARFVEDLSVEDVHSLLKFINGINESLVDIDWKVSNLEINSGMVWYGAPMGLSS